MNEFGGHWTQDKIKIVGEYAKAYLTIMNNKPFQLTYFDGFAGTGSITLKNKSGVMFETPKEVIDGMAKAIFNTHTEKLFDIYYFVELDKEKCNVLNKSLKDNFPDKKIYVVDEDCNKKLLDLKKFLQQDYRRRCLAFIDPFGMNLDFKSLEAFKNMDIDIWILVPTGLGASRMLKNKAETIPDSWFDRLKSFFGVSKEDIMENIYQPQVITELFGGTKITYVKKSKTIDRIRRLYETKLRSIFKYVSKPYEMRNSVNSTMYHFYLVSNNETAVKIANDIVIKFSRNK